MTIADADRIDIIAEDEEGEMLLVMVAVRDWSQEKDMLRQLSDKIHAYVSYARGSDYRKSYGDRPAKMRLITYYEPTDEVVALVEKASARVQIPIEIVTETFGLEF